MIKFVMCLTRHPDMSRVEFRDYWMNKHGPFFMSNADAMAYIMSWRIMKAYNLVKYTSSPLEQIAEQVGFSSARTLTKSFQRHYHFTPNQLRLQP